MSIFFEISTAIGCPVDCRFCPQDKIAAAYAGPRLMTIETFTACLGKMPAGVYVSFAGFAEPYLNRDTSAMIRHTAAAGHPFEVYTTGVGMDESDVLALAESGPVRVTLHLADLEGHAKIRVDERYVRIVTMLADRTPCRAMTMGTLPPALRGRFGNLGGAYMHTRAGNVRETVQLNRPGRLRCRAAAELDHNILLPDGSLVLCCMDYGLRHVIGNLLEQSWEQIRSGESLAGVRRGMECGDALCRRCEYAEAC